MKPTFDLAIAYRIYPKVSKTPFIHPDNKLNLAEVGVRTLKRSLGSLNAKIFFILDNCPKEYETMIEKYFSKGNIEFVRFDGIGNLPTFEKQIDILLKQDFSKVVYFAEDDYVYRPSLMQAAVNYLNHSTSVDFITPYDHLDSYTLPIHTQYRYEITIDSGLHWRSSASTCLTFLTTKDVLKKTHQVFRTYSTGNWDSSLWFALTKYNVFNLAFILRCLFRDTFLFKAIVLSWIKTWRQIVFGKKYKLWQPMPSIATHMEKISLAPNIEWQAIVSADKESNA